MSEFAIETKGLKRSFSGFEALRGIDLQVPLGSTFGLVGPNGSGKTTTFSILCGFLKPSGGEVRLLGHPANDRRALLGRVGALPQDAPLPTRMTTLQALRYWAELGGASRDDSERLAREALERVGLSQSAGRKGNQLSHGMAKRVALAQAFLGSPELVFLDEPTAGLDPRSAAEIKDIIRSHRGQMTIVLSTHELSQIEELCDAVAILDRGLLKQQGPIGEVTGQGELVRIQLADPDATRVVERLKAESFVSGVLFVERDRVLEVRVQGAAAEVAVPALLRTVLDAGGRPLSVVRGRRLEERLLELT